MTKPIRKRIGELQHLIILLLGVGVIVISVGWILTLRQLHQTREELETLEHETLTEDYTRDVVPSPVTEPRKAVPESKGNIALIIDDFGYRNDTVSDGYLTMDADLTFAIIPGHRYSQSFGRKAIKHGFDVIVHMPMESRRGTNGEDDFVLTVSMSDREIKRRIKNVYAHLPMAVGMNNHQGSLATENERLMRTVAGVLKEKNKFFIDSRTTPNTVAESICQELGVSTGHRSVFLDNESDPEYIRGQLDQLTSLSEKYGTAIGIGHARENTLTVLRSEIPALIQAGYRFVFVRDIVQ